MYTKQSHIKTLEATSTAACIDGFPRMKRSVDLPLLVSTRSVGFGTIRPVPSLSPTERRPPLFVSTRSVGFGTIRPASSLPLTKRRPPLLVSTRSVEFATIRLDSSLPLPSEGIFARQYTRDLRQRKAARGSILPQFFFFFYYHH